MIGHKHTKAPKKCNHKYIFLQLLILVMYEHHILDYFCLFKYIWLTWNLI